MYNLDIKCSTPDGLSQKEFKAVINLLGIIENNPDFFTLVIRHKKKHYL